MLRKAQAQLSFSGKLTAPRPQDACSHLSPGNITARGFLVLPELQVLLEASFDHFWVQMHLSTHLWGSILHHGQEATGIDKEQRYMLDMQWSLAQPWTGRRRCRGEEASREVTPAASFLSHEGSAGISSLHRDTTGLGSREFQYRCGLDVYKVPGGDGYTWMALKLPYLQLPW